MEMLLVAAVTLAAFGAVLIPLLRRREPGSGDDAAEWAAGEVDRPDSGHMLRAGATDVGAAHDPVEYEIARYRTALRAGTVCRQCGQANPADAKFCYECGRALPRDDAREFS